MRRGLMLWVAAAAAAGTLGTGVPTTVGAQSPTFVDTFQGLTPQRLLDTRAAPTIDGAFSGVGALAPGASLDLTIAGRGAIPSAGVDAVGLNVTATGANSPGYLSVWPAGTARPTASNLNFAAEDTVANATLVQVGAGGAVSIFNGGTTPVHVIVDSSGWFPTGDTYHALNPVRLVDTRVGAPTIDGVDAGRGTLGGRQGLGFKVAGRGGVPADGAGSVALNVTVAEPMEAGFLTASPEAGEFYDASTVNFAAGQTIAALAIVPINVKGEVWITNGSFGGAEVIVDVMGWFPDGSSFTGLTPFRVLDTRPGGRTVDKLGTPDRMLSSDTTVNLPIGGRGIPAAGVGSVALNVTVVDPTGSGYLSITPQGSGRGRNSDPTTSAINFSRGETRANAVLVPLGGDGQISIRLHMPGGQLLSAPGAEAHVLVDVMGWFPDADPTMGYGNDLTLRADGVGSARFGDTVAATDAAVEAVLGQRLSTEYEHYPEQVSGEYHNPITDHVFDYPYSQTDCYSDWLCITYGGETSEIRRFVGWSYAGDADRRLIDANGLSVGSQPIDHPGSLAAIGSDWCDVRVSGLGSSGVGLDLHWSNAPGSPVEVPQDELFVIRMHAGSLRGHFIGDC